jgi:hypothetical protein
MVFSCIICRRHKRKCVLIKNSEACKYCTEKNKTCIRFKPSNPQLKIIELTKQNQEQEEKIKELEKYILKLKENYKNIKSNLIARKVLDHDLDCILEI